MVICIHTHSHIHTFTHRPVHTIYASHSFIPAGSPLLHQPLSHRLVQRITPLHHHPQQYQALALKRGMVAEGREG